MSAVESTHDLDCARDILRYSTEARNEGKKIPTVTIEELLARPKFSVQVNGMSLLEYLDPVQDTVSKTFETESDLLSVFTGS